LTAQAGNTRRITFKQDELIAEILSRDAQFTRDAFKNHWLDIEDTYREQGWTVEYDSPGYNESYDAYFVFSHQK
jgi:hypothetical protein